MVTNGHHPQRSQGAAARPSRWRPATSHRHRAGPGDRLSPASPPRMPRSWAAGSAPARTATPWSCTWRASRHTVGVMQTPDAIARVASECAQDLAADGIVYAEVRYAPELSTQGGLSLDEVMEAWLEWLRDRRHGCRGGRPSHRHPGHRHGHAPVRPLGGDRRALGPLPRSGHGRLRHRRPRGRLPAESPSRCLPARSIAPTSTSPSMPARPSGCPRSGRRCSGVAPSGWGTACASWTTSRSARRATSSMGRLAQYVRDIRVPLEMCPTSNVHTGAVESIEKHPIDLLRRLRYPRHGQHRQPAHERRQPERRVRDARRRPSTSASTRCSGSRRTR